MILTGGFDGFDVLTAGFDVFDVLTAGFDGFDVLTAGFDDFDRWFWCFWWFWQVVFVFEGCIINDRRFCLLKTLLSGNFPPTRGCVSMAVLWRLFTAVNKKLIVYKNSLLKKSTEHYFSLKSLTTHVTLFTSCFVNLTNVITFKMYDLI